MYQQNSPTNETQLTQNTWTMLKIVLILTMPIVVGALIGSLFYPNDSEWNNLLERLILSIGLALLYMITVMFSFNFVDEYTKLEFRAPTVITGILLLTAFVCAIEYMLAAYYTIVPGAAAGFSLMLLFFWIKKRILGDSDED